MAFQRVAKVLQRVRFRGAHKYFKGSIRGGGGRGVSGFFRNSQEVLEAIQSASGLLKGGHRGISRSLRKVSQRRLRGSAERFKQS